jgi:N-glycosidase YbiA
MVLNRRLRKLALLLCIATAGCASWQSPPTTLPAPTTWPADVSPGRIGTFQGQYRFLSNFWPATVEYEGIVYPDVEHAYQSAKTLDMNQRRRIAALPTPAEAKRAGEALPLRADWLQIKYQVMLVCVRYKFTHHPELAEKLLATGDAYLQEGNYWGDRIWGVYQGQGTNWLGKILMRVRNELQ